MKRYDWLDLEKQKIIDLYDNKDYTVDRVADLFGVSKCVISNRLSRWGKRNSDVGRFFRVDIPENIVYNLYIHEDLSLTEIGNIFNCGKSTIHRILIKYNIPRRKFCGGTAAKNPNWKGGVTPERIKLYNTDEWKKLSLFIWQRDRATCKKCNYIKIYKDKNIHIHHLVSFASSVELRMEETNLILLCEDCHNWVHSSQNISKLFLKEI